MLNARYLSKKYKIKEKEAQIQLDIARKEAKGMGKEKDDSFVEDIFKTLINWTESVALTPYRRQYESSKSMKRMSEIIMSSSIPQDMRPEQHNVSDEDKEKAEKLKKQLGIKQNK